ANGPVAAVPHGGRGPPPRAPRLDAGHPRGPVGAAVGCGAAGVTGPRRGPIPADRAVGGPRRVAVLSAAGAFGPGEPPAYPAAGALAGDVPPRGLVAPG